MAKTTKTFRVFVSSTFSDLKAERNALQERVHPRLRNFCQQNGSTLSARRFALGDSCEKAIFDPQTMKFFSKRDRSLQAPSI